MSTFYCPLPLLPIDTSTNTKYSTTIYAGEYCAIPCPTLEWTVNEWHYLTKILTILVIIATILSFVSLVCHIIEYKKYFIRCMFIGM